MSPIWTAATVLLVLVLSVANSSDFTIAFDVEVPSSLVGTKEILDLVMRAKVVWFQPLNPERFLLVDQGYWSNHLFLLDFIKLGYFIKWSKNSTSQEGSCQLKSGDSNSWHFGIFCLMACQFCRYPVQWET